jgi:hypothetical protein
MAAIFIVGSVETTPEWTERWADFIADSTAADPPG